jgi:AraC-like DNA-binding protein
VHTLRLAHARKLLLQTEASIAVAAFESGFEDLSHFNRAFRKAFGCPPRKLRAASLHV